MFFKLPGTRRALRGKFSRSKAVRRQKRQERRIPGGTRRLWRGEGAYAS